MGDGLQKQSSTLRTSGQSCLSCLTTSSFLTRWMNRNKKTGARTSPSMFSSLSFSGKRCCHSPPPYPPTSFEKVCGSIKTSKTKLGYYGDFPLVEYISIYFFLILE